MAAGSPAITASFDGSPYRVGGIRFAPKLISIWGAAVSRAVDQRDASSDAVSATLDVEPEVASKKILHHEIVEGKDALERPTSRLFLSGLSAGLEIGFSLFLMGVMRTLTQGQLSNAVVELLSANMYSFGFVLVILGRSEFFTEQTSLGGAACVEPRSFRSGAPPLMGRCLRGKSDRCGRLCLARGHHRAPVGNDFTRCAGHDREQYCESFRPVEEAAS